MEGKSQCGPGNGPDMMMMILFDVFALVLIMIMIEMKEMIAIFKTSLSYQIS